MSAAPTPASPQEALKAGFRRACVRRLVGDEQGAVEVLRDEIPGLVVGWAKNSSLDPSEKKAKLKEMFDDESCRADELAVAFDLFAGRFETRVAELIRNEVATLADRIELVAKGLNSALGKVEEVAQKIKNLPLSPPLNAKQDSPTPTEKIPEGVHPGGTSVEDSLVETKDSKIDQKHQRIDVQIDPADEPDAPAESLKIPMQEKPDDSFVQLDPPSGTGLRFDEIEEMIDEILSYETK